MAISNSMERICLVIFFAVLSRIDPSHVIHLTPSSRCVLISVNSM